MLICENCEQKDICTIRTRCERFRNIMNKLKPRSMSQEEYEQFEREWQQATDILKKFIRGGN